MRSLELTKERLLAMARRQGNCLIWTHATAGERMRYGSIKHRGKSLKAHRVSYELHFGAIPAGAVVMHQCDEPLCINPHHLKLGTQAQNVRDMLSKNRANKPIGERNAKTKLTAEQVLEIRKRFTRYDRVNGARALGRQFGVSKSSILAIVKMEAHVRVAP